MTVGRVRSEQNTNSEAIRGNLVLAPALSADQRPQTTGDPTENPSNLPKMKNRIYPIRF